MWDQLGKVRLGEVTLGESRFSGVKVRLSAGGFQIHIIVRKARTFKTSISETISNERKKKKLTDAP